LRGWRGTSLLMPGVCEDCSIVDKFLEYSQITYFQNGD
jgi:hypothetical protein